MSKDTGLHGHVVARLWLIHVQQMKLDARLAQRQKGRFIKLLIFNVNLFYVMFSHLAHLQARLELVQLQLLLPQLKLR